MTGENPDKEKIVSDFQSRLHSTLNSKNIKHYVKSFMTWVKCELNSRWNH